MNHRERVLAALSHQQPDRVPIDLGATRDSSIVIEGYQRLLQHFGIQDEIRLTSRMMQVVDIDERVLQALDIDTRGVFPPTPPDTRIGENHYRDEWGIERVRPAGSFYYDQRSFPLAGQITAADIARYPWPNPDDPIRRRGLRERVRTIRDELGCAVVLNMPSGFVHVSQYLRGFEDWFVDLAVDHKLAATLYDAVLEVNLAACRAILDEVGDEVDVLMASDDLGLQGGLMMSPVVYRELIKPRHRRYLQLLHELSPAKVFFHTCGSVVAFLQDFYEAGIDILNPVQTSAANMDPRELKRRFGDRIAFWGGGVDTQQVLPYGAPDQVRQQVRERIEILGAGGGYVFNTVHNVQPNTPIENVLGMYETVREYGRYR